MSDRTTPGQVSDSLVLDVSSRTEFEEPFSGAGARTKIIYTSPKEIRSSNVPGGFSPLHLCHRLSLSVQHPRPGAQFFMSSPDLFPLDNTESLLIVDATTGGSFGIL